MESNLAQIVRVVERAARELLASGATPGVAVSLVRGGVPVWSGGFGVADPSTGRVADGDTLYRIASVTKPFTATAVLQLRDEGRFALHDPLIRHLPEVAAITDPFDVIERVTIGQLLAHTAGLQTDVPMDDPRAAPGLTQDALLARLARVRIIRPPDTRWHYSNVGYELLAILVARLTGTPYPEHLSRVILAPAGLSATTYHPGADLAARLAVGVLPGGRPGAWRPAPEHDSDTLLGDGGLWSSANDLARWIGVQCHTADGDRRGDGPRVLDGPSLRELQRPVTLVDQDGWRSAQGPGWATFRIDEQLWQGHSGSLAGFRSIVLLRAGDGLGVVALANGPERPNPVAHAAARALLAAARDVAPTRAPAESVPQGAGPIGRWVNTDFSWEATVGQDDDRLVIRAEGGPPAPLEPTDEPGTWRIAGDDADAGELVRHLPAEGPDRPETLRLGGWPFRRAD